jgi:hypothetical protein
LGFLVGVWVLVYILGGVFAGPEVGALVGPEAGVGVVPIGRQTYLSM